MEALEYIKFRKTLDLEWEEQFSMDYSTGLYSYWEIYRSYRFTNAMENIKNLIPPRAMVGIAGTIARSIFRTMEKEEK